MDTIVDRICDRFEEQLRRGESVRIENELEAVPEAAKSMALCQLIKIEHDCDLECEMSTTEEDYLDRFPNNRPAVQQAFREIKQRSQATGTALSDGVKTPEALHSHTPSSATESEAPVQLPAHIGPYRVTRHLGSGAFSHVYLASKAGGRQLALKVLKDRLPDDMQLREMFEREAQTLKSIRHPAIVEMIDEFVDEKGRPCLVTELMAGGSLAEQLPVRWTYRQIARFVARLSEAVYRMHVTGYTHRDLKPANILLDADGNPKIADVGLALADVSRGKGKRGSVTGSIAYLSPEQARGDSHVVDGRTDVYSLGIVLYELLTGERPFRADETLEQLRQIQEIPLPPLRNSVPEIPRELEQICFRATQKDPADRYDTAADFARDLRRYAGSPAYRVGRLVVLTACAAVTLFIGWRYWSKDTPPSPFDAKGTASGHIEYRQSNFVTKVKRFDDDGWQPVDTFPTLRRDDLIQFSVRLDEPAYVKLVWIDAAGQVLELYPDDPDLGNRGSEPVTSFRSPSNLDQGWPLQSPTGKTELALLFVSSTPFEHLRIPRLSTEAFATGSDGVTHHLIDRSGDVRQVRLKEDGTRSLGHVPRNGNDALYSFLERLREQADVVHAVQIPTSVEATDTGSSEAIER